RTNHMYHLPMSYPFSAGAIPLFALCSGQSLLHAGSNSIGGTYRDIRFHPALPESKVPVHVRSVDCPSHTVFIKAHIPVGHGNVLDVRINKLIIPGKGIGYAINIIPPT